MQINKKVIAAAEPPPTGRRAAIVLAAACPCDPRLARGFIDGRPPKSILIRRRLAELAAELGIAVAEPPVAG